MTKVTQNKDGQVVDKAASRLSIIANMAIGETYTVTEFVDPAIVAEYVQEEMNDLRKTLKSRLSSSIHHCQKKTGNTYSQQTLTGITTGNRFAVSLIIERTA